MALLLSVIPSALGLVLGPIISFRSDRYRSKLGRRVPFLLAATPVAALAMAAIAFSPMLGTSLHHMLGDKSIGLNQCILIFFGLFWVIFEIATVIANSVFGAFLNDVVPKTLLGRFFGLFRAVSLIAGMIFNWYLFEKAEQHYVWLFVAISSLYGVGFTATCLRVKEGHYPPPPAPPPSHERRSLYQRFIGAASIYFKECYSKPYYLWVFLAFAIAAQTFMPVNLYSLPYALSLDVSNAQYGKYLTLTYFISLCLSYLLGMLADYFHPLRVGIVSLFLYGIACLWGGFMATSITPFAIAFVAHGFLSGTYMTATASLAQRIYPHEKFAQFASAGSILGSLVSMVASLSFGIFLDATGNQYRFTFMTSSILAFISMVLLIIVYAQFNKFGGIKSYVAPE